MEGALLDRLQRLLSLITPVSQKQEEAPSKGWGATRLDLAIQISIDLFFPSERIQSNVFRVFLFETLDSDVCVHDSHNGRYQRFEDHCIVGKQNEENSYQSVFQMSTRFELTCLAILNSFFRKMLASTSVEKTIVI